MIKNYYRLLYLLLQLFNETFFFNIFRTTKGSHITYKNDSTNLHKNVKFWNGIISWRNIWIISYTNFFSKHWLKRKITKRVSIQTEENEKTGFFFYGLKKRIWYKQASRHSLSYRECKNRERKRKRRETKKERKKKMITGCSTAEKFSLQMFHRNNLWRVEEFTLARSSGFRATEKNCSRISRSNKTYWE